MLHERYEDVKIRFGGVLVYGGWDERKCAPRKRFDVGLEAKDDFNRDIIPEEVRQEFENNRISLSDRATVSAEEEGSKWLITDQEKTYTVIEEEGSLNIYEVEIQPTFVGPLWPVKFRRNEVDLELYAAYYTNTLPEDDQIEEESRPGCEWRDE